MSTEPAESSPPPPRTAQAPLSLTSLPPELLTSIAALVYTEEKEPRAPLRWSADDTDDEDNDEAGESSERRDSKERSMSATSALSLTCREMYEVCRPLLWESVDLRNRFEPLSHALEHVLPRHVHLIRTLRWKSETLFEELVDGERRLEPLNPSRLFAALLRDCRSLQRIEWITTIPGNDTRRRLHEPLAASFRMITDALLVWAPQITSLRCDPARESEIEQIALFLERARNIEHLFVEPGDSSFQRTQQTSPLYRRILSAIFSLPRLVECEIWHLLPPHVVELPLVCPLQRLLLDCSGPDDPHHFRRFLEHFAPTLTTLEVYSRPLETFYSTFPLLAGGHPPFTLPFPRLVNLVLGVSTLNTLLPFISPASPVEVLSLAWTPPETVPEIKRFINTHMKTLKVVKLSVDHEDLQVQLGPADATEVEGYCRERGVRFEEMNSEAIYLMPMEE
ncbi:hypothetical protein JCM10207_001816 [Rhodosporidiobolus poonsookiae]